MFTQIFLSEIISIAENGGQGNHFLISQFLKGLTHCALLCYISCHQEIQISMTRDHLGGFSNAPLTNAWVVWLSMESLECHRSVFAWSEIFMVIIMMMIKENEEFDDDKKLTLTICLKSDISGKVSHLQIQYQSQKKLFEWIF